MTERLATVSAENEKRAELSPAERSLLNVDRVDEWRDMQYGVLDSMRQKAQPGDDSYVERFNSSIDDALESYLNAQGVAEDSTRRDELRRVYRGVSIDRVSDSEWYTAPSSRGEVDVEPGEDMSRRDRFIELTSRTHQSQEASTVEVQPDVENDIHNLSDEELEQSLSDARDNWASLSAKRQGRARNQRIHGYNQARDDYNQLVREKIRRENVDIINDDDASATDKNAAVIASMLEEDKQLRELTTEKLQSTKISKFISWMNKGGPVRRIGKGILLGAGVGLAGSVIAGAAGAGLLAGGAIATATAGTRAFRGYVAADRDKRGMAESIDSQTETDLNDYATELEANKDDRIGKLHSRFSGIFEDGSQIEQNKRRRAIAWGMGTMAVGAGLGYLLHAGVEELSRPKGQLAISDSDGSNSSNKPYGPEVPDKPDDNLNSSHQTSQDSSSLDDLAVKSKFTVDNGHGYTHELIEAAQANGVEMTTDQAWQAHQQIVDAAGQDYIDLGGGSGADIYQISDGQYQVGIAGSGPATWSADAQPLVADAIDDGEINGSIDESKAVLDQIDDQTDDAVEAPSEHDSANDVSGIEAAETDGSNLDHLSDDIDTITNMVESGQFDELNANNSLQDALKYLHADLSDSYYPGTSTPIVKHDIYNDRIVFNPVPHNSQLPEVAKQALQSYRQ